MARFLGVLVLAVIAVVAAACQGGSPATASGSTATAVLTSAEPFPTRKDPTPTDPRVPTPSGFAAMHPPYRLDYEGEMQFVGSVIVGTMEGTRLSMSSHPFPQNAPVQVLTNAVVEAQLIYSGRGDHYTFGALWGSPLAGDSVRVSVYRIEEGTLRVHSTQTEAVATGAIGLKGELPPFETPGRYRVEVTTLDGLVLAWVLIDVAPKCEDGEDCSGG